MKVLYDYQIFAAQEYGGISRYYYELLNRLASSQGIELELPLRYSNNVCVPKLQSRECLRLFPGLPFRGKSRLLTFLNKRFSIAALKRGQFDVFHPTYYNPYFLAYCVKPFVLTVYDMIHERFPGSFSSWDKTSVHKRLLCQRAKRIIAISQNTKNDIIELFKIPADKIVVVPLGNSLEPWLISNSRLPHKFILFVGVRGKYKNFKFLVSGLSAVLKEDRNLNLVCAGGGGFTGEELHYFAELGISGQVFQFPVNDLALAQLYKNAVCFVFPSLYEGFGIPILEAFGCGCPVLLSRASCFPEIAGDAALYFDLNDVADLPRKLKRILSDSELVKSMVAKGAERLRLYSWDRCATETLKIYNSLV